MAKTTMTAVRSALHGKRVRRTVEALATTADLDGLRSRIIALLQDNNIAEDELLEDEHKFYLKTRSEFWMKPKLKPLATGTLYFRSRDYYFVDDIPKNGEFTKSYGDLAGTEPLENNNGFRKPVQDGAIIYTLIE